MRSGPKYTTLASLTRTPSTTYEAGRRCLRCDRLLSIYNPEEICAPCMREMRARCRYPEEHEQYTPTELRVLWCLREISGVAIPLQRIINDVPSGSITGALNSLERKGFVFERVRGHGCALVREP